MIRRDRLRAFPIRPYSFNIRYSSVRRMELQQTTYLLYIKHKNTQKSTHVAQCHQVKNARIFRWHSSKN
jgi:hypothetical protein